MIQITDKTQCCGCTACEEICPVRCITMQSDYEGFLYPKAEKEKCINCGACESSCPELNYKRRVSFKESAYLVQNNNTEILKESTSGGAFTAIAQYVINNGGIVYGAVMDSDTFFVHHMGIEEEKNLYKFRNSKYVQSDMGECYKEAQDWLSRGRMVCFSGTPCQIEGLLGFLGNRYEKYRDKLLTVDVVCRAVPSPGVWKQFIDYVERHHGKIESVRFRDKELGYQYSTMAVKTEDGKTQRDGIETSQWLHLFFSGMIIRPSCTRCKFRSPYRRSDFTLWDCFPTYRFDRKIDEDAGTTRVLIHSENGASAFKSIRRSLDVEAIDVKAAISDVREVRLSPRSNDKRISFYESQESGTFEEAMRTYSAITLKDNIKKDIRRTSHYFGLDKRVKHVLKRG